MDPVINEEEIAIDFFCKIIDLKNIFKDVQYLTHLKTLQNNCVLTNTLGGIGEAKLRQFVKFMVIYLKDYFNDFDKIFKNLENETITYKLELLHNFIWLIIEYTHNSISFCEEFHKQNGLNILFSYFKISIYKILNSETKSFFSEIVHFISVVLFNLSKVRPSFKEEWKELQIFEFLCELINFIQSKGLEFLFEAINVDFIMTISLIYAKEDDLTLLNDIDECTSVIIKLMGKCVKALELNEIPRREYNFSREEKRIVQVHYIEGGWNILELMESLYRFSIIDNLKWRIFLDIRDNLEIVIRYGKDSEKEFALKILYQLCFNPDISRELINDYRLIGHLKELNKSENENLVESCSGILMLCKYEEEKYEHDQSKYEQILREMPLECCARIPEQEEIKKTQTGRIKQLNSLHENSFNEEKNFGQSCFISDDNLYYASLNDFDKSVKKEQVISVELNSRPKIRTSQMSIREEKLTTKHFDDLKSVKKEQVISVELNSRPKIHTSQMSIKEENLTTKHIMISYNSKSKETCLKIKNKLQENGFQTWIDVENICGSSLESMAKAIEESHCVLMCMTEKYKESANCRLEAEYSVKLNKPIIPLIMEKGYQPDGWLGIILGSKIFIDFLKYEITECFKRLDKEIDNLVSNGKIPKPEKIIKSVLTNDENDISKIKANPISSPLIQSTEHEIIDKKPDQTKINNNNLVNYDKILKHADLISPRENQNTPITSYFSNDQEDISKRLIIYYSNAISSSGTERTNPEVICKKFDSTENDAKDNQRHMIGIKATNLNDDSSPKIDNKNIESIQKKIVLNWSENDVNKWIKENTFDSDIIRTVYPCNGEHLARLHDMYQKIPEYFYNSINFKKRCYVKDLVHFSNELVKLFK